MYYTTSKINETTRYTYHFDNNSQCDFYVSKSGVIYIHICESIPNDFLTSALNEVTDIILKKGLTPQINIKNSNIFLIILAKKCKYKKIPSRKISFSIWKYKYTPQKNKSP